MFINLQAGDVAPPPKMTEEQVESHLVGVIMVQHYTTVQIDALADFKFSDRFVSWTNLFNDS